MSEKIACIVIDDDQEVSDYIIEMIKETPALDFLGAYSSPANAMEILGGGSVELIFLDINMPGIDGMSFAKSLQAEFGKAMPRIIFISGSGDYALEGYKVDAIDYLLKPFTYESFFRAVLKAKGLLKTGTNLQHPDSMFVKVAHELVRVPFSEILYVESMKDYVKVFKTDGTVVTALSTMKAMEEKLPLDKFMRLHRSFIIALDKIASIQQNSVKIGNVVIPVTDQYRTQFKAYMDKLL
ncbi:MAG: response regulator transcription factor [Pedobacter sp.]|nr:MAG: response regulator transcription factor [Pedobacter sp.]